MKRKEGVLKGFVWGIVCYAALLFISNTVISGINELTKQPQEHSWTLTAVNPIGEAWDTRRLSLLEVEVKGSWGAGNLSFQGSSNGKDFRLKLRDSPNLTPISLTSDPVTPIVIWETPNYVRPVLTGADARDSIVITLIGKH